MSADTASAAQAASSSVDYARAMLNILVDLTEDKLQLRDAQAATLNILSDFAEEKQRLELSQRAVLNVLDDFDKESRQRRSAEEKLRQTNLMLEQRVAERTQQLESANQELETFAFSVSHDLRAPLRAIDGFSRILLEDYGDKIDAEGRRVIQVIRDSTVKMSRMIEDILAFSRVGRTEQLKAPVDMDALARTTINDLQALASGRKIEFVIGKLPPALADAAMMQRVWTNLIDNAIKYTGQKAAARIEIGATPAPGETVYYVRDNGAGFDMRYVDKLFGVFQRLHGAEFAGTGVGLAIVKRIVTRHGGRVWAKGEPNAGASFYFALPQADAGHA